MKILFVEEIFTTELFGPQLSIMALISVVSIKSGRHTNDKIGKWTFWGRSMVNNSIFQNMALQNRHTTLQQSIFPVQIAQRWRKYYPFGCILPF